MQNTWKFQPASYQTRFPYSLDGTSSRRVALLHSIRPFDIVVGEWSYSRTAWYLPPWSAFVQLQTTKRGARDIVDTSKVSSIFKSIKNLQYLNRILQNEVLQHFIQNFQNFWMPEFSLFFFQCAFDWQNVCILTDSLTCKGRLVLGSMLKKKLL